MAGHRVKLGALLIAAASAAGMVGGCAGYSTTEPTTYVAAANGAAPTYSFLIPLGTAKQMDAGQPTDVFPSELTVHVGEVLRIVNDDDRGHVLGPFYVGARQTLTQRFTSPGELSGTCSVHADGTFTLRILP